MKKTKTQKGITLIALIITIVVLLILAVVAIGAVRDSNIIAYAQNAGTGYEQAKSDEESLLEQYESKIDQYLSKNKKYATVTDDDTFLYLTLTPDNKLLYEVGSYSMNLDYSQVTLTEEILANAVGDSGSTNLADYSKALRVIAPDGSDAFVVISKDEKILYLEETPCFLTIPTDSYDRVYSQDGMTITLAANNTCSLSGSTTLGIFEYIDLNDEMTKELIESINSEGMPTNPEDYSKAVSILYDGEPVHGLVSKDEKILYIGETALTLTGTTQGSTTPTTTSDFTYENETITGLSAQGIQKVTSGQTEITIPSEIDGQAITAIADYAFFGIDTSTYEKREGYNQITKITISGTIQTIGDYAFGYNEALKTLIYEEGTKTVGKYAYHTCSALTYIELPSTIEYIVEENSDHGQEGELVIKINKTSAEIIAMYNEGTIFPWNYATIKDADENVVTKPTT